MRTTDYIVPARFVVTLGHLLVIVMAFWTLLDNVETTIGITATLNDADLVESTTSAAQVTLWICLGLTCCDLLGLVSGITMFLGGVNVAHIMLHFLGSLYMSWFIMYQWNTATLWYIWGPFNLLPFLIELAAVLRVTMCGADVY